jgi:hypothetical protein
LVRKPVLLNSTLNEHCIYRQCNHSIHGTDG